MIRQNKVLRPALRPRIPLLKHLEEMLDPGSHQSFPCDVFTCLTFKLDNISLEDFSKIGQDPQTSPAIHPQESGKNLQKTRQCRLQITHHPVLLPGDLFLPIHVLPSVKPDRRPVIFRNLCPGHRPPRQANSAINRASKASVFPRFNCLTSRLRATTKG